MACWGAEAAVQEDEGGEDLMRDSTTWYKSTGSDAVEDEDDDLMREIYEAMEAQCGLRGGGPSPSTRRPTPASRPSWCLADALSRRGDAMADALSSESRGSEAHDGAPAGSSERWEREVEAHTPDAPPHNGVPPRDERSGAHEGVLHLSQAERWSSTLKNGEGMFYTPPHLVWLRQHQRLPATAPKRSRWQARWGGENRERSLAPGSTPRPRAHRIGVSSRRREWQTSLTASRGSQRKCRI